MLVLSNKFNNISNLVVYAFLQVIGSPTILCVIGSRMFFNLKEAAEHGVNVGTNWASYSHTTIRFDEPQSAELQSEYVTRAFYRLGSQMFIRSAQRHPFRRTAICRH